MQIKLPSKAKMVFFGTIFGVLVIAASLSYNVYTLFLRPYQPEQQTERYDPPPTQTAQSQPQTQLDPHAGIVIGPYSAANILSPGGSVCIGANCRTPKSTLPTDTVYITPKGVAVPTLAGFPWYYVYTSGRCYWLQGAGDKEAESFCPKVSDGIFSGENSGTLYLYSQSKESFQAVVYHCPTRNDCWRLIGG